MEEKDITLAGNEALQTPSAEPTAREYILARLSEKYPDDDLANEDTLYSRLREDIDNNDRTINDHNEREKELANIFSSDPRSAQFLTEWAKGGDPVVLLMRNFGDDFRAALDDPENIEKFTEARGEYIKRQAKERDLKDQAEKNLAVSLDALDSVISEDGYSEEQADQAFELLNNIVNDAIVEKVSKETWRMIFKALNYERDVEDAAHTAEVRGRNTKIDETRLKRTTPANLPPNPTGGGIVTPQERTVGSLERISAANGLDIFERGNPQRKKRN